MIHTIDVATGHDRCAFELNSAASYMTVGAVALVVGMSLYLWRRFKKSRAL
ncbi:MAG: hypothetical protein LH650_01330 [Chloroflexi bacterium]|nr:hypothetical protein [Chloroflexota bacterium]